MSLQHSDCLWPLRPQCSHFTLDFAPALAFGFSLVVCQRLCCMWPDFPHAPQLPANLIVICPSVSPFFPFLPLPPFPSLFVLDTKDLTDFHEHLCVGVKVSIENKMVGEVSEFFLMFRRSLHSWCIHRCASVRLRGTAALLSRTGRISP